MARAPSKSVLVVDDSALVRRVVRDAVAATDGLSVCGEAANGLDAIASVHALSPDLVTLDINMPGMSGLDVLGYVMSECPRPVVMLSGEEPGEAASLTIRALELGAVDFVRKPSSAQALDVATLQHRVIQSLREAASNPTGFLPPPASAVLQRTWREAAHPKPLARATDQPARAVIVVAASTGGPRALTELTAHLSGDVPFAVCVAQHLPGGFTQSLARRLDALRTMPTHEAWDGELLRAGVMYVAPGGFNMRLSGGPGRLHVSLATDAILHGVRPAADPLFMSAAEVLGPRCGAVVLTGMGKDSVAGCRAVRRLAGRIMVQDPAQCAVNGMPSAVLADGGADVVGSLETLATEMRKWGRLLV